MTKYVPGTSKVQIKWYGLGSEFLYLAATDQGASAGRKNNIERFCTGDPDLTTLDAPANSAESTTAAADHQGAADSHMTCPTRHTTKKTRRAPTTIPRTVPTIENTTKAARAGGEMRWFKVMKRGLKSLHVVLKWVLKRIGLGAEIGGFEAGMDEFGA
ncbi:hypothetical protein CTI12_AA145840 [Artemisia annua]|uniref:Uncharacterized protein n=1 Tax=Artemisia annua TaxID=35608 RepID=A0A2U1PJ21_ARTAN|nr:hypothetical protein CTI12_AA145840 [Artemisia annua]